MIGCLRPGITFITWKENSFNNKSCCLDRLIQSHNTPQVTVAKIVNTLNSSEAFHLSHVVFVPLCWNIDIFNNSLGSEPSPHSYLAEISFLTSCLIICTHDKSFPDNIILFGKIIALINKF